ncbi:ester cyclase [Halobium salinum]|uniref:Ester cyclase n=1 Tax=Halobium salinum TaxID=1364940 RepID=A0ABD5PCS8_9EURY|nr:ester cyclase [Halobium salinum]
MSTGTRTEQTRAVVQREIDEVWSGERIDAIDDLYAEDVVVGTHRTGDDAPLVGREATKELHREWDAAFPDAVTLVNEMLVDGDTAMVWWTFRGTHEATFRGIEPTGRTVETDGFSFRRIEGGRVAEMKDFTTMASLFEQLGVEMPA